MALDPIVIATAALAGLIVAAVTLHKCWQGWLALKTRELETRAPDIERHVSGGAARIELADLKERVRRLEAIAAGVDL